MEKLVYSFLGAILSGLIVHIIWKYNTKESEKQKIYLPFLDSLSSHLIELKTNLSTNYSIAIQTSPAINLINSKKITSEFKNIPKDLQEKLLQLPDQLSELRNSLVLLIQKARSLENTIKNQSNRDDIEDMYIIDLALLSTPPKTSMVLNFPMEKWGGFHTYCYDIETVELIYERLNSSKELTSYKKLKDNFEYDVEIILHHISKLQNV